METRGGYKACEANVNRTFTVQINPARLQISLLLFSILGLLFKQMRTKPADEGKTSKFRGNMATDMSATDSIVQWNGPDCCLVRVCFFLTNLSSGKKRS